MCLSDDRCMRRWCRLLAVFVVAGISATVSSQEKGWIQLFNGTDLSGWRVLNGTAPYHVVNGEIVGTSQLKTANTFLATEREFTHFILEYEMKMDEGLNSGVQVRSRSTASFENGRVHGLQIECEDTKRGWSGGIYDEARKGWRYPLEYHPAAKPAYRIGAWNTFRVLAVDDHILVWLNGVPTAHLIEDEVDTGFVALQVHAIGNNTALEGKQVRWKNIRLRTASAEDLNAVGDFDAPDVSYRPNQLTPKERAEGWKLLWDGRTTAGWRGARLDRFPDKGWTIKDGVLHVQPSGGGESTNGGDIVTVEKYRNFVLELDVAISRGANSGIKYFVDTELNKGPGSSIGCEFQILDDDVHPDAKLGVNGNRTMGSLYDLIKANGLEYNPHLPREKYVNGPGYWNRVRVVVEGNRVRHFLNGIKVVEYERNTQAWRALVAYSKYRDWPRFGDLEEGNILLQDHGDEVKFRSIKIKELNQD